MGYGKRSRDSSAPLGSITQNEPKSAEVMVIDWFASYFLSCRLDIKGQTLKSEARRTQSLLEMPKSQRLLPRPQGQAVSAGKPKLRHLV